MSGSSPPQFGRHLFASKEAAIGEVAYKGQYEEALELHIRDLQGRLAPTDPLELFLKSAVSRSRAFHEATAREIGASNPHATVALLRQFTETVVTIIYVADHHTYVSAIMNNPRNRREHEPRRKKMGKMVSEVDRRHSQNVGLVYPQMSDGTHFGHLAFWEGFEVKEGGRMSWSSAPRWRSDEDFFGVCDWLLDISAGADWAMRHFTETCEKSCAG